MDRVSALWITLQGHLGRYQAQGLKSRAWWIVLTILLIVPYLLAGQVEATDYPVFKQFLALYVIDSVLFFSVEPIISKIGLLTLIFLTTLEMFAILYYVLTLYARSLYFS